MLTKQKPILLSLILTCAISATSYSPAADAASSDRSKTDGRAILQKQLQDVDLSALRRAITDLTDSFKDQYPAGKDFLATLDALEKKACEATEPDKIKELAAGARRLEQDALTANPLVSGQPLVYISRVLYPFGGHHAIDTHFHTDENNTHIFKSGGSLKVIDLGNKGTVRTLIDQEKGMIREPDIHFSGNKIVFSMRRDINEDYHIWEIDVDPGKIMTENCPPPRQLTSLKEVSDIDPLYLPDGGIVFTSTRERKYNMCSRDVAGNLFRMESDGANIIQITKNTLYDNHASLLPDGRILYARWEYVDRNFGDAHGIWTVNPDGTGQAIYWGNNTTCPGAVFNQRIIPGTQKMLCIFGPHHDWLWGSMAIVDRSLGMDVDKTNKKAVTHIWPADHMKIVGEGSYDTFGQNTFPRYCDPYPLNDKYFLCSKQEQDKNKPVEIFLVDIFGNEIKIHSEQNIGRGCYNAMPLKPRRRPPVVPFRRDFQNNNGTIFMQDVYQGTHMKGVERGSIKYLRVVESPPKKSWSWGHWGGQGYQAPGMNWHSFENKRILGTVPVEEDGSALFEVPSDKFIYFQALDKDMMMVQSMRSGTILQSNEKLSCVGCHEDRMQPPPSANTTAMAMKRAPSKLKGWHGPARLFNYAKEVQPVFDRQCVKCHDFGKDAGKTLVLAGDRNPFFNASYIELWLWHKKRIKCIGGGPADIQQAYSWGSHPSLLSQILRPMSDNNKAALSPRVKELREKHKDITLTNEDIDRINTWLDINGPYYPDYLTAYPGGERSSGRSPLTDSQLDTLTKLTGCDFSQNLRSNGRNAGVQLSFDRPELSPCLQKLDKNSDAYREALALIRAGGDKLKETPRCEMDGFIPCPQDQKRIDRYNWYQNVEQQFRTAITEGHKLYDRDIKEWK